MKKLFYVVLLVMISPFAGSQTLYLTHQPNDISLGLNCEIQIFRKVGLLAGVSHGKYRLQYGGFKEHTRFIVGVLRYKKQYINPSSQFFWGCALSYTPDGYGIVTFDYTNCPVVLRRTSFEPLVGMKIGRRFAVSVAFDFIKHESSIGFGYNFNINPR